MTNSKVVSACKRYQANIERTEAARQRLLTALAAWCLQVTQKKVGEHLGISVQHMNDIMRGRRNLTPRMIDRLSGKKR